MINGARWYVVQTQPRAEHKAAAHLGRQGFGSYLPQYLKKRRHARRVETVAAPLFPRYLFVAVDIAAQRWRSIQSTIGVARLVCNGDAPAPVPEAILTAIKQREDERGFVRLERRPLFALGDSIRVLDGVFGPENYRNEIIWRRFGSHNDVKHGYASVHDVIFFYVRSSSAKFTKQFDEHDKDYFARATGPQSASGAQRRLRRCGVMVDSLAEVSAQLGDCASPEVR